MYPDFAYLFALESVVSEFVWVASARAEGLGRVVEYW
jgi:hypothetical protein